LFCKVSQYSKEELLGKTHKILQSGHHNKQFYKELWSTISSGNVWIGEIKNKARDGSFYWTFATIIPSLDQEGKPFQYVSIRMDITEKKKIEDELFKIQMENQVALEMIEEKNKFMDIAAHELRTPITALSLFIQNAEKKIEKNIPLTFDFIAKMKRPADRLAKLVTNLLEISKERRGFVNLERTQVDLDQLIFECLEDFKVLAKNVNFIFTRPLLPISMNIDPLRINQVLSNLLDNAIKYAGERDIEVALIETSQCVRVLVIDRGYGISKDQQEKIFMAFSRGQNNTDVKASGLGLGLAVCKGIIDLHHGCIGVESIEGKGSTFYFELPKT
jgi:PAS domain S-box-containing protein